VNNKIAILTSKINLLADTISKYKMRNNSKWQEELLDQKGAI
jgi:hypothetical protein